MGRPADAAAAARSYRLRVGVLTANEAREERMDGYRLTSIDDLPSIHHGSVKLAGAGLGVESFGLQVLDLPAGFDRYPEHDHAIDGQEEVYVVLAGSAAFELAGDRVEAREGHLVWVAPGTLRKLTPGSVGVRVLAIGCSPGRAYERPADFRLTVPA
jgi:mannose-6-phosphate isomerase-like protein (cupin superfamily)